MSTGGSGYGKPGRPRIALETDLRYEEFPQKVTHNGSPTRVVLRHDLVSVGCTDVTPQTLKYLLDQWEKKFGPANEEVELQP